MRHLIQLIFRCLAFLKHDTDLCSRVFLFQNESHSRSILTKTKRKYYSAVSLFFIACVFVHFYLLKRNLRNFYAKKTTTKTNQHTYITQFCITDNWPGWSHIKINSVKIQKNKIDAFKITHVIYKIPAVFKFQLEIWMLRNFQITTIK